MLTRLKISGFKNLVDVDVRFGAFTCIAGANGVGKSNLFDAIQFLSELSQKNFVEAALSIRSGLGIGRASDVRNLFHRVGQRYADEIFFEAEMIIAPEGRDELGQKATASTTFVRYSLRLGYELDETVPNHGRLVLRHEELSYLKQREFAQLLPFPHSPAWRHSVLQGRKTSPFISTLEKEGEQIVVQLHQDQNSGRPKTFPVANLPRTLLSTVTASESPTSFLAQQEMRSWRLLQLEPSVLRQADEFVATSSMRSNGQHLPATLDYLARYFSNQQELDKELMKSPTWLYEQVALRLSRLIDDVQEVTVDRDEQRQLLTVEVLAQDETRFPARDLSDGTLRFLALSVLELDPRVKGLICLEEPENGIHPKRIAAMLQLLQDMAVDVSEPVAVDNPLRQVIINTHSPAVVLQIPPDSLLVAYSQQVGSSDEPATAVQFGSLPDEWRARKGSPVVPLGKIMAYLQVVMGDGYRHNTAVLADNARVIDSPALQPYLPAIAEADYA